MIVVGPRGERSAISKSWPFARSSMPVSQWQPSSIWAQDFSASYSQLYRSQPWVYVVVNKLSRAVAQLPLHVFERERDGGRTRQFEGTLNELLARPYPRASGMKLKEHAVSSIAIYGNALLLKRRPTSGSAPDELWPLDWRRVDVFTIGAEMSPIDHYEYRSDTGSPIVLAPEDVVHLQWWGPDGVGVSPLEPLRFSLANEAAAGRYSTSSFTNGVRPSGALVTAKNLRPEQRTEIRAEIEEANAGADNAGRMLLLDGGLDWKAFGGSAADSQMIDVRKLNREEVCAVYDVPPPMVGILDRATFSNVDEQHKMLYQDTLGPWLALLEQGTMSQLVEPEDEWAGLFVEFLLDEVLRGDVEKRSQAYQRFILSGIYTPNELRRAENLPTVEHPLADSVWVPLNAQPLNDESASDAITLQEARQLELVRALVSRSPDGNGSSMSEH